MQTSSDFRDLLAELNAAGAEYLVVGAHALAVHGHARASKDLDSIEGVEFEIAWPERVSAQYADQDVHVISRAHLIENKKAVARPQDLADVDALQKLGGS